MTIDIQAIRYKLTEQIAAQKATAKAAKPKKQCEHEFKRYRESIPVDNEAFTRANPHFITIGCSKCHEKRRVDYVLE